MSSKEELQNVYIMNSKVAKVKNKMLQFYAQNGGVNGMTTLHTHRRLSKKPDRLKLTATSIQIQL